MAFKGMCLAEGMSSKRVLRNALLLAPFLSASLVPGVVVQREGTFVTAASTPPREAHANFLDRGVGEGDSDQYPLLTGGVNDSFMLTGEQEQDEQQQNTLVNLNVGYGGEHGHDMPQFAVQGAIEGENREEQPNRSMNHHFYERRGMGKRRAGRGRKSGIARRHSSETRNRSTIATIAVQTIIAVGVLAAGATFALRQLAEVRRAAVDAEKAALLEIQRKHKEEATKLKKEHEQLMKEKKVLEAEKSAARAQAAAAAKKPERKPETPAAKAAREISQAITDIKPLREAMRLLIQATLSVPQFLQTMPTVVQGLAIGYATLMVLSGLPAPLALAAAYFTMQKLPALLSLSPEEMVSEVGSKLLSLGNNLLFALPEKVMEFAMAVESRSVAEKVKDLLKRNAKPIFFFVYGAYFLSTWAVRSNPPAESPGDPHRSYRFAGLCMFS